MQALRPVTVDLATGVVTLGGTRVALQRDGEQYVTPGGPRLRALTFEERSWVVAGALMSPEPNRALLSKLRNLANVTTDGDEMTDALLLALAGGGESASSFNECARAACRMRQLDWRTVQQTSAVVIDQLALPEEPVSNGDGWRRFSFHELSQTEVTIEDCCTLMLEQLLERGTPQAEEHEPGAGDEGRSWHRQPEARVAAETDSPRAVSEDSAPTRALEWPRAVELRARATFDDGRSQAANADPPVSNVLRTVALWPQGRPQAAEFEGLPTEGCSSNTNDGSNLVDWAENSPIPGQRHTTLRHTVAPVDSGTPSAPTAVQELTAAPSRQAPASPAKPRLRAHRRDLSFQSKQPEQLAAGEHFQLVSSASSPTVTPTLSDATLPHKAPRVAHPQRDWIYEIATALADECDLRGLDA